MKRMLLAAVAVFVFAAQVSPALAINSQISVPARTATYSATITGMTPAATATDFFTLTGSATMVVRVKIASCTGTSTAVGSDMVDAVLRSAADTGGTSTTPTAVPNDSSDVAATAVVHAYTANPTVGTAVGVVRVGELGTNILASTAPSSPLLFSFGTNKDDKEITLRGTSAVFALNSVGSASFQSGTSLSCYVEWTEAGS